jgi:hypothetical protein
MIIFKMNKKRIVIDAIGMGTKSNISVYTDRYNTDLKPDEPSQGASPGMKLEPTMTGKSFKLKNNVQDVF